MLTNDIIAIQYTRGYCYPIIHQGHKIMHMYILSVMLSDLWHTEHTNDQLVLHNTYGKYYRLNCIDS